VSEPTHIHRAAKIVANVDQVLSELFDLVEEDYVRASTNWRVSEGSRRSRRRHLRPDRHRNRRPFPARSLFGPVSGRGVARPLRDRPGPRDVESHGMTSPVWTPDEEDEQTKPWRRLRGTVEELVGGVELLRRATDALKRRHSSPSPNASSASHRTTRRGRTRRCCAGCLFT
jgi:hypothetical protein